MLLLVSAVFMIILDPILSIIFLVLFPPLAIMQMKISKPIGAVSIQMSKDQGAFNAVLSDSLQNSSTIVAYGLEEIMEERYSKSYDTFLDSAKGYIAMFVQLVLVGITATQIPFVFITITAALAVVNQTMTLGSFIALTTIAASASTWLTMLSQRLNDIQVRLAGAIRLRDNTSDEIETIDNDDTAYEFASENALQLKKVSFSYGGSESILQELDLSVAKGERVAIVGGAGKSTLLKIILGLYRPESGVVSYGKELLAKSSTDGLHAVREICSYMPQDSFLFPLSIRENITGSSVKCIDQNSSIEFGLKSALEQAAIYDFVQTLPQQTDTVLNETADNVSGGQKQRLALARAFYRQAPLLLLDEPTSGLDPVNEETIINNLFTKEREHTIICVSHRPAVLKACDRIIVLDQGRVAEEGSFEECLANNGIFTNLYRQQIELGRNGTH
jgi:ATP-binding cassette subfamily B protein